jgi:hypothetical protein
MNKTAFALLLFAWAAHSPAASADTRCILVCADPRASATTSNACARLLTSAPMLFQALRETGGGGGVERFDNLQASPAKRGDWDRQALNHLVVVGTPDEGDGARRTQGFTFGVDTKKREMYRLGIGRFAGDVGSVETTFNPYLYCNKFDDNPYSTLLVRISGTTPRGVALAADAFARGLLNGMVAGPGAQRVERTILDRAPSVEPPPALWSSLAQNGGRFVMAGWSQCPENEYRACLDMGAAHEPQGLWRIKYLIRGSLDGASAETWANSPQAMAWGNAVTLAAFADPADAAAMIQGVRKEAGGKSVRVGGGEAVSVPMPVDEAFDKSLGRIVYWHQDGTLVMSSMPDWANEQIFNALLRSPDEIAQGEAEASRSQGRSASAHARPGSAELSLRPETEAAQGEAEASRSQGRSASAHARPGSAELPLRPETEAAQGEAEASRSQGRSASAHAKPGSAELPLRPETEAAQGEAEASRSQGRSASAQARPGSAELPLRPETEAAQGEADSSDFNASEEIKI